MLNAKVEVFHDAVWGVPPGANVGLRLKTSAQAQETFLNGVLRVPWHGEKRNPLDWAVSLLVHIVIVAAIIVAPLFLTETINLRDFQSMLLVAPKPPAAAPAPLQAQKIAKVLPHAYQPSKLTAPVAIPAKIAIIHDEEPPSELIGVAGGVPGGQTDGVLGGILGGVAAPKPPAPPAATERKIIRVGGDVKQPEAISTPPPVYPVIARSARQQGVVIIDAVIDEQGNVVQEQLVEGPPLLAQAALDAVRHWKYRPTYLNGEPVAIRAHLEVHFQLQ